MNPDGKSRDELAREANEVRSKLLRTVEQLDRRRHDILDVRIQLQRHVRQLLVLGGVLLLATAGAVALVVQRIATAGTRRRRNRWKLAKRLWWHPERTLRAERRSFFGELVRWTLLAVASTAVTFPARRAMALLLRGADGETPAGSPAGRPNRAAAH